MKYFRWRQRKDEELNTEIQSHLDEAIRDRMARGESAEEAQLNVRREFGNVGLVKEITREMWGWVSLERLMQDLRFGWRMLWKNKGFTAVAVLSLALGIGANTAIFSLMDAVLLRMLPVTQADQLYFISNVGARGGGNAPPYPCFERFRGQSQSFAGLAAFSRRDLRVSIDEQREEVQGQFVSGNYFAVLGVNPLLGRALSLADDSVPGKGGADGYVAVISYNYWTRRFGRSPDAIGKVVRIGNDPVTIIGVTPPEFYGLFPGVEMDISLPMAFEGPHLLAAKQSWWFHAVGRLKPTASVTQAQAELDAIFQPYMAETTLSAEMRRDHFARIELTPAGRGLDTVRRQFSRPLQILMAMVVFVLAIACANVANLLLARATVRRKEFGVRLALGASRWRLMRQLLTESLLLVFLGGLLGLWFAHWSGALLKNFFATGSDRLSVDVTLNYRVLLFNFGIAALTGLLFGFAPAWQSIRLDSAPALKETATTNLRRRTRFGQLLVITQVALSLPLLVGAGLFLQTMRNLTHSDVGFQREGVITMRVNPSANLYRDERLSNLWQDILARTTTLPGVRAASLSTIAPLGGVDAFKLVEVAGFTSAAQQDQVIRVNQVSDGFFQTFGISLLQGRTFNEGDNATAQQVALLNQTAARFYFGNRNPLGAQLSFRRGESAESVVYQVVGVVSDSRYANLRESDTRSVYLPMRQAIDQMGRLILAVRGEGQAIHLTNAVRNELRAAGKDILVTHLATLNEQADQSLLQERLLATLSGFFGGLALLLASIGLYGVMSYDVAQRTNEIGIRMALGAQKAVVLQLILRQGIGLVGLGIGSGLIAAFSLTGLISSQVYGVQVYDPMTFVGVVLMLISVTLLACWIPARRATKVDPMIALRCE